MYMHSVKIMSPLPPPPLSFAIPHPHTHTHTHTLTHSQHTLLTSTTAGTPKSPYVCFVSDCGIVWASPSLYEPVS